MNSKLINFTKSTGNAEPSNHDRLDVNSSNRTAAFDVGGSDDEYRPDVDDEQNFEEDFNEEFMWNPDLNSGLFTRFVVDFLAILNVFLANLQIILFVTGYPYKNN